MELNKKTCSKYYEYLLLNYCQLKRNLINKSKIPKIKSNLNI